MPPILFLSFPTASDDGLTTSPPNGSKPVTSAFRTPPLLVGSVDRAARHDAHKMGAIFGAAVDVAVEAIGRDLDVLDRRRREALGQGVFHRLDAEDSGAGTGHGN